MKTLTTVKTMTMALGLAALLTAPALADRGADRAAKEKHGPSPVEMRMITPLDGQPRIERMAMLGLGFEAVGEDERMRPPPGATPNAPAEGPGFWQRDPGQRYPGGA